MNLIQRKKLIIIGSNSMVMNKELGDFINKNFDLIIRVNAYTEGYEKFIGSNIDIWSIGIHSKAVNDFKKWFEYMKRTSNIPREIWFSGESFEYFPELCSQFNSITNIKYYVMKSINFSNKTISDRLNKKSFIKIISKKILISFLRKIKKNIIKLKLDNILNTEPSINFLKHPTTGISTVYNAIDKYSLDYDIYVYGFINKKDRRYTHYYDKELKDLDFNLSHDIKYEDLDLLSLESDGYIKLL